MGRSKMSELLPCPFCGETPAAESAVQGTQYEIWCDCGMAGSSIQISDLMTGDERQSVTFINHKFPQVFIDRARNEAIKRWNDRV